MIAIIDYDAGNLTSVKRALDYIGLEAVVTKESEQILRADRVIFPGVGHAKTAMDILSSRGLDKTIRQVFEKGTPLLGICLGTQIILSHSEEGNTDCLGLINGSCLKFNLSDPAQKIPHMGWNTIKITQKHTLLKNLKEGDELYFVHSYYPQPSQSEQVYAVAEYGIEFPVAIGCKNLFGTQFHPEKSGPIGLQVLKNFSEWDGTSC